MCSRFRYYTTFVCKAENSHGTASLPLELRAATVPGAIRQVVMEKVTATTIRFRFVPPASTGGLPLVSYVAEYKESRQSWKEAKKRFWFQGSEGSFELGNLQPWTSYQIRFAVCVVSCNDKNRVVTSAMKLRFGCANNVGISSWAEQLQITLPKPGRK